MKLTKVTELDKGTFGTIFLVKDETGKEYTLKLFQLIKKREKIYGILNLKEIEFMFSIKHPYLNNGIYLGHDTPFDVEPEKDMKWDKCYIVYPYAEISLSDIIKKRHRLSENLPLIFYQILLALEFLHSRGIVHRDIKTNNILVYDDHVKITDYGHCKHLTRMSKRNSQNIGTYHFRAPELLLKCEEYDYPIDIWSTAYTFLDVISEDFFEVEKRFSGKLDDEELFNKIVDKLGGISPSDVLSLNISDYKNESNRKKMSEILILNDNRKKLLCGMYNEFCDLIDNMLCFNPKNRFTASQCLNHPFFDKVRNKKNDMGKKIILHNVVSCEDKDKCMKIIKELFDFIKGTSDLSINANRIAFIALDMFNRCIENGCDKDISSKIIAYVVCYMSLKYILGESCMSIKKYYPKLNVNFVTLETAEKLIIEKLKHEFYRKNVYDLMNIRSIEQKNIEVMFDIISKDSKLVGKNIEDLALRFQNTK